MALSQLMSLEVFWFFILSIFNASGNKQKFLFGLFFSKSEISKYFLKGRDFIKFCFNKFFDSVVLEFHKK